MDDRSVASYQWDVTYKREGRVIEGPTRFTRDLDATVTHDIRDNKPKNKDDDPFVSIPFVPFGEYTVQLQVSDRAGNKSAKITQEILADDFLPSVSVSKATDDTVLVEGPAGVECAIFDAKNKMLLGTVTIPASGSIEWELPTSYRGYQSDSWLQVFLLDPCDTENTSRERANLPIWCDRVTTHPPVKISNLMRL